MAVDRDWSGAIRALAGHQQAVLFAAVDQLGRRPRLGKPGQCGKRQ
jgi:hypothetical protein